MASLTEIIKIIARHRITVKRATRVDVVIIHSQGAKDFAPSLKTYASMIIDPLPNMQSISLHPAVMFRFIMNRARGMSLQTSYLASLIMQIKPQLVVTRVHNSKPFQSLDRAVTNVPFLALQNGTLAIDLDFPRDTWTIYHSHLACIGRYEIDQYTKHEAEVENFHVVGSLKLDQYLNSNQSKQQQTIYDICLVSDYGPDKHPEQLCRYLAQYSRENKCHLVVAGRTEETNDVIAEEHWFRNQLGENITFVARTSDEFASYKTINNSKVVVAWCSSMLRESLALNKPILAFNPTGYKRYNFPVPGKWALEDSLYSQFSERMDWLLSLSTENFEQIFGDLRRYLIANSDDIKTQLFLKSLVTELITN